MSDSTSIALNDLFTSAQNNAENSLLTVDIGNTNIKLCSYSNGQIVWRDTLPTPEINFAYAKKAFNDSGASNVAVSSVVKPVNVFFREGMLEAGAKDVLFINPTETEIMPHNLLTPQTTGADRFLAAYAAKSLKPNEPVIVIQAGTALVVNSITADGVFQGGFILPGPGMWLDSLTSAAQLQYFPYQEIDWSARAAGRSTREAILGGAGLGMRGALKEAVRIISMTLGGAPSLIFTGGWGDILAECLPGTYEADLVNIGIYLFVKNRVFPGNCT